MTVERLDLLGAITAYVIFLASIVVFTARIADLPRVEQVAGWDILVTAIPLVYLMIMGPSVGRPPLYYVQVGPTGLDARRGWALFHHRRPRLRLPLGHRNLMPTRSKARDSPKPSRAMLTVAR